jgi:hypothetical protein
MKAGAFENHEKNRFHPAAMKRRPNSPPGAMFSAFSRALAIPKPGGSGFQRQKSRCFFHKLCLSKAFDAR